MVKVELGSEMRMKLSVYGLAFSLVSLIGCSHIQFIGADKDQNTVSLKGGTYDTLSSVRDAAEKHCRKPFFWSMAQIKESADYVYSDEQVPAPDYIYTFKCDTGKKQVPAQVRKESVEDVLTE